MCILWAPFLKKAARRVREIRCDGFAVRTAVLPMAGGLPFAIGS